ncbi:MAG: TonB family protein [Cardiobacteriaceae bacterium]|nr:TonB family protein [Cardiobacteriaceae bacterium]
MRNATALLLSAALHIAIASVVWRQVTSHTISATDDYQPFDLNMLAIMAPPVPEPQPKAEKPKPEKPRKKPVKKQGRQKKKEKAMPHQTETAPSPRSEKPLFTPAAIPPATQPVATPSAPPASQHSPHPSTGEQKDALKIYHGGLQRALARNKPRNIRDQGTVTIAFTVEANGRFSNIRISKSSGNPALDNAALATVQKTAKYQPTPSGQAMSFNIPIRFSRK